MKLDLVAVKKILLQGNYLEAKDFEQAELTATKTRQDVLDVLIDNKIISWDIIGQAMAEHFGVPYLDLKTNTPNTETVLLMPEPLARSLRAVTVTANTKTVTIATDHPDAPDLLEKLTPLFGQRKIRIGFALSDMIDETLKEYRRNLGARFKEILAGSKPMAPEIITEIISDAVALHASDIHFEPQPTEVMVRFRIDGVLQEAVVLPKIAYETILNRLKVQGNLRIDEHLVVQDGAIRLRLEDREVDLRVSIVPTIDGEKVVVRVLAEYVRALTMADLGFSPAEQQAVETAVTKPYGLILAAGPTGSGKTTTLYTILKVINHPEVNITTIEDPVEYKIPGTNQIQVSQTTNLTFAKGLRAIVRQDPDVILVGEIRDQETAEISVNAALTGHLVLSSFHANDAATTIPRLIDLGVEPFLLASTLELIIAQRLVRRICRECRISYKATTEEIKVFGSLGTTLFPSGTTPTLYRGVGCSACRHRGYRGRIAVIEIVPLFTELKELILQRPSAQQINNLARQHKIPSMFADGLQKVQGGETTLEELQRVIPA